MGIVAMDCNCNEYCVVGAGTIRILCTPGSEYSCGKAHGVSIGTSWGRFPFSGGVMDRIVVKQLVEDLQAWLNTPLGDSK